MKFYHLSIGELHPDLFSSIIQRDLSSRHGVKVDWSHSAILVEDAGEDSGVYESVECGFRKVTLEQALHGESVIRHKVELDILEDARAIEWLKQFLGTPYSLEGFAVFAPSLLTKLALWCLPGFIIRIFVNGRNKSYCSESTAWFMRDNCKRGYYDSLLSEKNCDKVNPYVAYQIASKQVKII